MRTASIDLSSSNRLKSLWVAICGAAAFASSRRRAYTSATATAVTFGQRSAVRKISMPRLPEPMSPIPMRSFDPCTRPETKSPDEAAQAAPLTTWRRNLRRLVITHLLRLNLRRRSISSTAFLFYRRALARRSWRLLCPRILRTCSRESRCEQTFARYDLGLVVAWARHKGHECAYASRTRGNAQSVRKGSPENC